MVSHFTHTIDQPTSTAASYDHSLHSSEITLTAARYTPNFDDTEHTSAAVSFEQREQPNDPFATHKQLIHDIDELSGWEGTISADRAAQLREEVAWHALELARQILPADTLKAFHAHSVVPDPTHVNRTPTVQEVRLLGTAWDITQNPLLQGLLEATIEDVPDTAQVRFLRSVLTDAATNGTKFSTTYMHAEAERLEADATFDIDQPDRPVAYMAFGASLPAQSQVHEATATNPEYALSSENERLVGDVVATAFPPSSFDTTPDGAPVTDPTNPRIYYPTSRQ